MKKEWISIDVSVKGALVELAGAVLALQGCCGTLIEDQELDSFEVPDARLDDAAEYSITTYFQTEMTADQLLAELKDAFARLPAFPPGAIMFSLNPRLTAVDWAQNWKQNFTGFQVGSRLIVHPSWEKVVTAPDQVAIEIDPGMAFGTGTHATTRLCLEVVAELLADRQAATRMLDVGTGSGILAIGAAALGCDRVVGIDIDPVACDVARDNVTKNHYSERVSITGEPLESITETFDLVVANILAEENIRLREALIQRLTPAGWLVLSGILKEKEGLVAKAFAAGRLKQFPTRTQDDWVCLVFRRM